MDNAIMLPNDSAILINHATRITPSMHTAAWLTKS
jgi:hypothetical protein